MIRTTSVAALNKVKEYHDNFKEKVMGAVTLPVVVQSVPEPENKYDSNAVRLLVGGKQIGYIAKLEQDYVRSVRPEVFEKPTDLLVNEWGTGVDRSGNSYYWCSLNIEPLSDFQDLPSDYVQDVDDNFLDCTYPE